MIFAFEVLWATLLGRQLDEGLGGILMTTKTKYFVVVDCFFDLFLFFNVDLDL